MKGCAGFAAVAVSASLLDPPSWTPSPFSPIPLFVQAPWRSPLWISVVGTHHGPDRAPSLGEEAPAPLAPGPALTGTSTCLQHLPQSYHTFAHHICNASSSL